MIFCVILCPVFVNKQANVRKAGAPELFTSGSMAYWPSPDWCRDESVSARQQTELHSLSCTRASSSTSLTAWSEFPSPSSLGPIPLCSFVQWIIPMQNMFNKPSSTLQIHLPAKAWRHPGHTALRVPSLALLLSLAFHKLLTSQL